MVYLSSLRGMSTNIFTINSSFYPLRPLFIYSPGSHLLIHTRIVVRSRIRRISSLSLLFSPILFTISNLAITNRRVPVNRGEIRERCNLANERASERTSEQVFGKEGGSLRFFGTDGPLCPKRLRLLAAVNATKTTPRFDTHPWMDPPLSLLSTRFLHPSIGNLDNSIPSSSNRIGSIGSDSSRREEKRREVESLAEGDGRCLKRDDA